jgi:hypothetical protein
MIDWATYAHEYEWNTLMILTAAELRGISQNRALGRSGDAPRWLEGVARVSGGRKKDGGALVRWAMVRWWWLKGRVECHAVTSASLIYATPHHNDVTRWRNRQCSLSPPAMAQTRTPPTPNQNVRPSHASESLPHPSSPYQKPLRPQGIDRSWRVASQPLSGSL